MARFNSFGLIAALFFASMAVLVTSQMPEEAISPAPESDGFQNGLSINVIKGFNDAPPEPAPALREYLESCALKLSMECGQELFTSVFNGGTNTADCCHQLVLMGKPCHDSLTKFMITTQEYRAHAYEIMLKNGLIWNKCVSLAGAVSPTPSSSF